MRALRCRALRRVGNIAAHATATMIGADAADHHRAHGAAGAAAQQPRHRAGAEVAQLVGGRHKHAVHRIDPPAHLVRRPQLQQRFAHHHAHHVDRAEQDQRADRQPCDGREAEDQGEDAEQRHAGEHDQPGMVADREGRQNGRHDDRADRRRRPQQAKAAAAKVQDVVGVDRQQRDRATHQHREKVQRNRAQHHLLPPDIAEALQHVVQRRPLLGGRLRRLRQGEDQQRADDHEDEGDGVGDFRPVPVQQAREPAMALVAQPVGKAAFRPATATGRRRTGP